MLQTCHVILFTTLIMEHDSVMQLLSYVLGPAVFAYVEMNSRAETETTQPNCLWW